MSYTEEAPACAGCTERAAVVKYLRFLARTTSIEEFRRAFNIAADHIEAACHHDIERGEHVP